MLLEEVSGSMLGYIEARGSFDGIFSWKSQSIETLEDFTSMEVNLLPPTSVKISVKLNLLSPTYVEASTETHRWEVGGLIWKYCGRSWKFVILVEVGGSVQGYMEGHGSFHGVHSWKLELMNVIKASIYTDSERFHVFPLKLLLTSMDVKSTSTNFRGN